MAFQFALPTAAVVLLLALVAEPVQSQVYKLEQDPAPAAYSLSMQYLFYVYSQEDSPKSSSGVHPSVEFRQLEAHKTPEGTLPSRYNSLEVSIMPYDKFWGLVNKDRFCASSEDVARSLAARPGQLMLATPAYQTLADLGVRTQSVPLGIEAETVAFPITSTGKYALVVSNCGNHSGATFTGSVAVKHSHGYLPAYAFNAMRAAGWLAVLSTAIFVVWTSAVVSNFQSLIYVQKGILVVSLLCVLEAFTTWFTYQDRELESDPGGSWSRPASRSCNGGASFSREAFTGSSAKNLSLNGTRTSLPGSAFNAMLPKDWNATGHRRDSLFFASLLFYMLKYVFSWRLLLHIAVCAGTVMEDLDWKTSVISQVASAAFVLQAVAWKLIVSYRFSHALASTFLLLATFPGVAIHAGMSLWTFLHFSSAADRVRQLKQEDLSRGLEKVRGILVAGFLVSCFNVTLQILDIGVDLLPWGLAWLPVEGAPQVSFVGALVAMMVVLWPTGDTWKYGFEVQAKPDEAELEGLGSSVRMEEERDDDAGRARPSAVAPEAIGAPEEEEEEERGKGRESVDLL